MTNPRISVRLDKATERKLKDEVQATGKNLSELVHEALAAYLQNRSQPETCLDLARRHGLVGRAKRLPSDLSTNRKYFEGFGR